MREDEIVTDAELDRVHGNANFGSLTKRDVLREGLLKRACGYHCGYTMSSILKEHQLVTPKTERLTLKGQKYLYAAFAIFVGRNKQ